MRVARLVDAVLSVVVLAASNLLPPLAPQYMRPIPGQLLSVGSSKLFVKASPYDNVYIPDEKATVPFLVLLGLLFVLMCVVLLLATLSRERYHAFVAFNWSMALTSLLTDFIKQYCGYFRPNFYGGCGWVEEKHACAHENLEGRLSFPSGHSSMSACAAFVVALYARRLARALAAAGGRRATAASVATYAVAGAALALHVFIAASRVHDNWHHPADVVGGAVLGAGCAACVYRLYFGPSRAPQPLDGGREDVDRADVEAPLGFGARGARSAALLG